MLKVQITSFSYKKGLPQDTSGNGGGFIFDCRFLNNPGRYEEYRNVTGLDKEVIDFFEGDKLMEEYLEDVHRIVVKAIENYVDREYTHLQVNFGCTGGRHRSVYSASNLYRMLEAREDVELGIVHRELG